VPTPEQGHPRSGPGRGGALEGAMSIVMDEGLQRQCGFEADHEGQGRIIRDEAALEGSSPR